MMHHDRLVPILYVEGKDDISVISNLLSRHGVDTERGKKHLAIQDKGNVDTVLEAMPEAIRVSSDRPVGFVVDIDIKTPDRWSAICQKIRDAGVEPPSTCPPDGYIGKLPDYPRNFGIWMMPDCKSDLCKLEHLVSSLIKEGDPLWTIAQEAVRRAAARIAVVNSDIADESQHWQCFRPIDEIKAEVHTWLSWQRAPGAPLGAAIQDRILSHDSPMALKFLRWLGRLYSFTRISDL